MEYMKRSHYAILRLITLTTKAPDSLPAIRQAGKACRAKIVPHFVIRD